MKKSILSLLALFFVFTSLTLAHKFYVSVTNINYSEKTDALQITSRIFVDDLEALFVCSEVLFYVEAFICLFRSPFQFMFSEVGASEYPCCVHKNGRCLFRSTYACTPPPLISNIATLLCPKKWEILFHSTYA